MPLQLFTWLSDVNRQTCVGCREPVPTSRPPPTHLPRTDWRSIVGMGQTLTWHLLSRSTHVVSTTDMPLQLFTWLSDVNRQTCIDPGERPVPSPPLRFPTHLPRTDWRIILGGSYADLAPTFTFYTRGIDHGHAIELTSLCGRLRRFTAFSAINRLYFHSDSVSVSPDSSSSSLVMSGVICDLARFTFLAGDSNTPIPFLFFRSVRGTRRIGAEGSDRSNGTALLPLRSLGSPMNLLES